MCECSFQSTEATPPALIAVVNVSVLRPRAVLLNGRNICEAAALTITDARNFFDSLTLSPSQAEIASKVLEEVRQRTSFLVEVGLEYLTLDRPQLHVERW